MTVQSILNISHADEIPWREISDPTLLSKKPLVSVFMLTYNHESHIVQAIEGVLMQKTSFPIELIIGEDCSTDQTREIVLKFQRKQPEIIRIITSECNVGSRKNATRTFKVCQGKYMAFCDGDDYWIDPLKLHKQVKFLEANPEYGMVHSDGDYCHIKKNKIINNYLSNKGIKFSEVNNTFDAILRSEYPIITCSVMLKTLLFNKFIHEKTLLVNSFKSADTMFWLEFAKHSAIHFMSESMVQHNILLESASQSQNPKKSLEFKKSGYELMKYYIDLYGTCEATERICHYKFNKVILDYAYKAKNKKEIEIAYKNLITYSENNKATLEQKLKYWGCKKKVFYFFTSILLFLIKVKRKFLKTQK